MSGADVLFATARAGGSEVFGEWMASVELAVRLSLRRYARAVDVEAVLQETFLRMWVLARDPERTLSGADASLKFALGVARNLARAEARRYRREHLLPPDDLPETPFDPVPDRDPDLRRAIAECLGRLVGKPRQALHARLRGGGRRADRLLAESLAMTKNTFLQNVVRARGQVAKCLERRGIRLEENYS
ncbi:MAG: hypothetical protein ACKVX7_15625 [Planctomycetota bacterium]